MLPIEEVKNFRPLDEPESVLGISFPHQKILNQIFVILVGALHMQVW